MSRVQLAINVPDLAAAIAFYSRLFGVAPHKERAGYANFEVADPPLKLVLVERADANQLNHLGVEVETSAEVRAETRRLAAAGMATVVEESTVCCHAEQDKVWVRDPAGIRWEVYAITDDAPDRGRVAALTSGAGCRMVRTTMIAEIDAASRSLPPAEAMQRARRRTRFRSG